MANGFAQVRRGRKCRASSSLGLPGLAKAK
jgi:hypothetical protein